MPDQERRRGSSPEPERHERARVPSAREPRSAPAATSHAQADRGAKKRQPARCSAPSPDLSPRCGIARRRRRARCRSPAYTRGEHERHRRESRRDRRELAPRRPGGHDHRHGRYRGDDREELHRDGCRQRQPGSRAGERGIRSSAGPAGQRDERQRDRGHVRGDPRGLAGERGAARSMAPAPSPGERARQRPAEPPSGCDARERDDEEERARRLHRAAGQRRREPEEQVEAGRLRREHVLAELLAAGQRVRAREVDALVVVRSRVEAPREEQRGGGEKADEPAASTRRVMASRGSGR